MAFEKHIKEDALDETPSEAAATTKDESNSDIEAAVVKDTPDDTYAQQSAPRVILLLTAVMTSMFLVALDRTIISTVWLDYPLYRFQLHTNNYQKAIPNITDDFHSLPDVGWYGSGYLLASCSFQLLLGKVYTFYAVKAVMLGCVLLFEVGSAICGAAPSSAVFIFGRAISGVGAAGIFAGCVSFSLTCCGIFTDTDSSRSSA